ncbi:g4601 [Coccomyxa elongata]
MTPQAGFPSLPLETCLVIFAKLDVNSLINMAATCRGMRVVAKENSLWKQIAAAKWGREALALCEKNVASNQITWFEFCKHRLCLLRSPRSPLNLVQEVYIDPWQHIVSCLLCSRTSGSERVRCTISFFLYHCQDASYILLADDEELQSLIEPLGLQETRIRAVKQMTVAFFEKDWKDPSEFYGCGKFTSDSWRIFCRGERSSKGVEDATLLRYLRWRNTGSFVDPNPRQLRSSKGAGTKCNGVAKKVSERSGRKHGRGQTEPGNSRVLRSHTKNIVMAPPH